MESELDGDSLLELPIVLIDPVDFTVLGLSEPARRYLGSEEESLVGRRVTDLVVYDDEAELLAPLRALGRRDIDSYRAHRFLAAGDDAISPITGWVRSMDLGDRQVALVLVGGAEDNLDSPLGEYLGREPQTIALGATDASWTITTVSEDIYRLLGVSPNDLIGQRLLDLVANDETEALRDADQLVTAESSVARAVHMKNGSDAWQPLQCVLTALPAVGGRCFILVPNATPSPTQHALRIARLARHLQRISAEVEASGVLQNVGNASELSNVQGSGAAELSKRQWEVLERLWRGERVEAIARAMVISQSTVRNHLSAIFEHFGVHSQTELLTLLRSHGANEVLDLPQ